jgi:hypothetical protein
MLKPGVGVLLLLVVATSACEQHSQQATNPDQDVVFAAKAFYNGERAGGIEEIVYIAGALTGAHVGYPNNYTVITCYRTHMECVVVSIDQIGSHQLGRIDIPDFYDVTKWDKDVIIAGGQSDLFNCYHLTITIVRTARSAFWVNEPINSADPKCKDKDHETYKWTIEDPPSWKAIMGGAGTNRKP